MENASNKRITKNTLFLYVRMAFALIVTLYTSRVILAALGVEDYGVYNVVAGFISMFSFLNTSLSNCLQRFYSFEQGKRGTSATIKVFHTAILTQLILAVVFVILCETLGLWYLNHRLVIPIGRLDAANLLFHACVFSMLLIISQVPYSALVMAKERMDFYAFVGVLDVILKLIIVLLLPLFDHDKLIVYALLLSFVSIIDFLLYFLYARRFVNVGSERFSFSKDLFVSMISFSGWGILGSFAQVIRNQGLNVILNLFFGPVVNAARGLSYQVQGAISGFISSISTAARPQITESYASGNEQRSESLMFSISKVCYFLLLLFALPLILKMNFVLHIWLGDNVPNYTAIFSTLILIVSLIDVFNAPVSIIIYATGRIATYNIVTSILGIISLPLAYVFLKMGLSPVSVYLVSIFVSIIVQITSIIILSNLTTISIKSYFQKLVLPCLIVTLLSIPLPLISSNYISDSFFGLIIIVIITSTIILSFAFLFGLDSKERLFVQSFIKEKISIFSHGLH